MNDMKIISGSSNLPLAKKITDYLGVHLTDVDISRFSDGEIYVHVKENVRGSDVFVVQSCYPNVNESFMELLVLCDALKRSSAKQIIAVIPYYAYARQDRKDRPRVPITAKLIADLLTKAGASRVLSVDLHTGQIQGFFDIPVDHLYAAPVLIDHVVRSGIKNCVVVSPDAGGMERARYFAKKINAKVAMIDKRRQKANVSEVMHVIGEIKGKIALIVDDIVDTAGTICKAADALKKEGATNVVACCTHSILSGTAKERITQSPISRFIVTDTIKLPNEKLFEKLEVLSVSSLIGEAMRRIYNNESVSSLFL
ncbi:MAG: ribose-phosphate pyrophosphokinase [Epsilonproteobacteria bacterium]|nr:ribose-phosphate pyrophosphokinase [Campylobacterota bacterium]